jgi:hypothetical protein
MVPGWYTAWIVEPVSLQQFVQHSHYCSILSFNRAGKMCKSGDWWLQAPTQSVQLLVPYLCIKFILSAIKPTLPCGNIEYLWIASFLLVQISWRDDGRISLYYPDGETIFLTPNNTILILKGAVVLLAVSLLLTNLWPPMYRRISVLKIGGHSLPYALLIES